MWTKWSLWFDQSFCFLIICNIWCVVEIMYSKNSFWPGLHLRGHFNFTDNFCLIICDYSCLLALSLKGHSSFMGNFGWNMRRRFKTDTVLNMFAHKYWAQRFWYLRCISCCFFFLKNIKHLFVHLIQTNWVC